MSQLLRGTPEGKGGRDGKAEDGKGKIEREGEGKGGNEGRAEGGTVGMEFQRHESPEGRPSAQAKLKVQFKGFNVNLSTRKL